MDLNPSTVTFQEAQFLSALSSQQMKHANEDTERSMGNVSMFHTFMLIRIFNSLSFGKVASSTLGSSSLTIFEQKPLVSVS